MLTLTEQAHLSKCKPSLSVVRNICKVSSLTKEKTRILRPEETKVSTGGKEWERKEEVDKG